MNMKQSAQISVNLSGHISEKGNYELIACVWGMFQETMYKFLNTITNIMLHSINTDSLYIDSQCYVKKWIPVETQTQDV